MDVLHGSGMSGHGQYAVLGVMSRLCRLGPACVGVADPSEPPREHRLTAADGDRCFSARSSDLFAPESGGGAGALEPIGDAPARYSPSHSPASSRRSPRGQAPGSRPRPAQGNASSGVPLGRTIGACEERGRRKVCALADSLLQMASSRSGRRNGESYRRRQARDVRAWRPLGLEAIPRRPARVRMPGRPRTDGCPVARSAAPACLAAKEPGLRPSSATATGPPAHKPDAPPRPRRASQPFPARHILERSCSPLGRPAVVDPRPARVSISRRPRESSSPIQVTVSGGASRRSALRKPPARVDDECLADHRAGADR